MARRRLATSLVLATGIAAVLSVRLSHPALHTDEITYMSKVLESLVQERVLPVDGSGRPFLNKPPLALWSMRLSFQLFGPSPFAARLPSVLATAATAVVLYLGGAAVFGETVGVLAALVFAFTPGLLALHGGRSATPDALEILLVTSAIVCLELWRRRRLPSALACLVASTAASAWVKSPFALLVIVAYLLGTELLARRAGLSTPRLVLTLALMVGAWIAAYLLWLGTLSYLTSPRTVTRRLLHQQYVRRVEGRVSRSHLQGRGYYLRTTVHDFGLLLLLPASAGAAALLRSRRGAPPWSHELGSLVVWSLAAPVLATASASKLPWYAYLSYPGIALLLAVSARRLAHHSARRSVHVALPAVIILITVWRLPSAELWPVEARHHGLPGRFWEIMRRETRATLVVDPDLRLPHGSDAGREAALSIKSLLWQQSRRPPAAGSCRAILSNHRPPEAVPGEAVELHPQTRRAAGLFLADDCGGRIRRRLAANQR